MKNILTDRIFTLRRLLATANTGSERLRLRAIIGKTELQSEREHENIMKVLAKEIKRIRFLVKVMKKFSGHSRQIPLWEMELETLKRILGMMIKKST